MKTNLAASITAMMAIVAISSCSAARKGVFSREITDPGEQIAIALTHKPELEMYHREGVLDIKRIIETTDSKGVVSYKIKHGYKKNHIHDHDRIDEILEEYFPELYRAHEAGTVHVDEIYKFVDSRGRIKYKVDYDYHTH